MSHHPLRRTERPGTRGTSVAAANARLVRRIMTEIWNGGDLALADRLFAPDYINHGGLIPDLVRGPEAIKISVVLYRTAFPEFRVIVLDLVTEGQTVALRWAAQATPCRVSASARWAGEPPAGTLRGMTFGRFAAGQLVESWTNWEAGAAAPARLGHAIRALARSA
jgi:predicted SnoaL-like aldol condensation-catalyzing enzyme